LIALALRLSNLKLFSLSMPLPAQPLFKLAEGLSSVIAARNGVPPSFGEQFCSAFASKKIENGDNRTMEMC